MIYQASTNPNSEVFTPQNVQQKVCKKCVSAILLNYKAEMHSLVFGTSRTKGAGKITLKIQ